MSCLRHSFGVFGAWGHHAIWNVVPLGLNVARCVLFGYLKWRAYGTLSEFSGREGTMLSEMACLRHSFGVFGAWGHHAIWNVVPMALNSLCDNRMLSEIACLRHSGPGHERHDAIWDKLTMELSWWTECLHPSSLNSSGALIIQLYLQYPIIPIDEVRSPCHLENRVVHRVQTSYTISITLS